MAKKSLRTGLDGWIKETKKSHDRLADGSSVPDSLPAVDAPPAPSAAAPRDGAVELRRLPLGGLDVGAPPLDLRHGDDPSELDALAESVARHGQWQPVVARDGERPSLVTGFRRVEALARAAATDVLVLVHPDLSADDAVRLYVADNLHRVTRPDLLRRLAETHGVGRLAEWGVPEAWLDAAMEPEPEAADGEQTLRDGILAVDDDAFEQEVLESAVPVLVGVHLPGHAGSDELQAALLDARARFAGELKLCAVDIMQSDGPAVPQLVKVGRGFLEKHLPRVQLYAGGRRRAELTSDSGEDLDGKALLDLLESELP